MTKHIKQNQIRTAIHYAHTQAETESFLLSKLAQQNALANEVTFESFQQKTGLADFFWETTFYQHPYHQRPLEQALAEAEGYVFFLHGWDGSHRIWETYPIQLAVKNKHLVCFNLDVNGFGGSPFLNDTPTPEQCSPAGLMAAVEIWMEAIGVWPVSNQRDKNPFYLFIGHSMSGAALFYKNLAGWQAERYGFYALAPALFCNNVQRRAFFKAMGMIGGKLPSSLDAIKNLMAPHVIEVLGNGASHQVKNEHLRIYNQTPFGTITQVVYTMGLSTCMPEQEDWSRYRVALGHRDRIIHLNNTLDLLNELDFGSDQIKVMLGDHYFFSAGKDSPASHIRNQKILVEDFLLFCQQLAQEENQPGQEFYANQNNGRR